MNRLSQLLCLALAVLATACGGGGLGNGDQDRPSVVTTYPAGDTTEGVLLGALRVDYDVPVRILNSDAVRLSAGGQQIATEAFQLEGLPNSVFLRPRFGSVFPPDTDYGLRVEPGLATNDDEHYMLENYIVYFDLDAPVPLVLGAGAVVHLINETTFELAGPNATVATPGGAAVGIITIDDGTARRAFVQLDDADALAWFTPQADAAMTSIPLAAVGALSTPAGTLVSDPAGAFLYAAYRDGGSGGIRVYRVDVAAQAEDAFLDLASVPTGPDTAPLGLALEGGDLYVVATDGTDGHLAAIDLESFTETDLDEVAPGTQGLVLDGPPGPATAARDFVIVADPDSAGILRVNRSSFAQATFDSGLIGGSIDIVALQNGAATFQPLAMFNPDQTRPITWRRSTESFNRTRSVVFSDLLDATISADTTTATAFGPALTPSDFFLALDGRYLMKLRWSRNDGRLYQTDLDPSVPGLQIVDLLATAPGITGVTAVGRAIGDTPVGP